MKKTVVMLCSILLASFLCSCGNTAKIDSMLDSGNSESAGNADENNKKSFTGTSAYDKYDVDLTQLDGTMVYAQVSDILNNPDQYNGKIIRAKGPFSYFQNPDTGDEYFATIISDATACCAQGIEFKLDGEHSYPDDYPALNTEITVTGICDVYSEGNATYCQLLSAEYEAD